MLAMLLVAALCPFIPTATAGADEGQPGDKPLIEELPTGFYGQRLNNNGQAYGYVWDGTQNRNMSAVYTGGEVKALPWAAYAAVDLTDQGKLLVYQSAQGPKGAILVANLDGTSTTLPPLFVDGEEKRVAPVAGPTDAGQVIGWTGRDAIRYVGATPPQVITTVATLFKVNQKGVGIVTIRDTNPPKFGLMENGVVREVQGIQGMNVSATAFSNSGHFLYSSTAGNNSPWLYHLWKDGRDQVIDTDMGYPKTVNSKGAVLLNGGPNGPALRLSTGQVKTISDLIGGMPAEWSEISSAVTMNDNCDVLMSGKKIATTTWVPIIVHIPDCEGRDFGGAFFRTDFGNPNVPKGESTTVRLRVANTSGVDMTNVTLTDIRVEPNGGPGVDAGEATLTPTVALDPTSLGTGMVSALGFAEFTLTGVSAGRVKLIADVAGVKADGKSASGTIDSTFVVRAEDLVVNLTLNPPDYETNEDGTFDPVDITATVSFTNETEEEMTKIKLEKLEPVRIFSGQQLYVTYKSGINPDPIDPEVIVDSLAPGATSPEFQAVFHASELGSVDFVAMATGKVGDGESAKAATGVKKVRWKAKTKKYIELKTNVTTPADGQMLKAGSLAVIDGTIENLTTNYRINLGAPAPRLVGNHGLMSIGYDGPAPNPEDLIATEDVVLEPGQKINFQVKFQTVYSDPGEKGALPSGGTRAYATFEPWGEAVEIKDANDTEPPEVVQIRTYDEALPGNGITAGAEPDGQVKASLDDVFQIIHIDDSIEIPEFSALAFTGGVGVGLVEGMWNATVGTLLAIPGMLPSVDQLKRLPASMWFGWMEFAQRAFDDLTPEQKDGFFTGVVNQAIWLLPSGVRYTAESVEKLYDQVDAVARDFMEKSQKDWYTGDYVATARSYSAFLSEQIAAVVAPIAIAKLAKLPGVATRLTATQARINARAAALFTQAAELKYVDNVLPVLRAIPNGAEPTMAAIAKLWGITAEEVGEYQRICKLIGCLATVRSRNASSIEWIQKFGAMLKPEAIKIKTVSELDVILGYRYEDLGSLVLRKPPILDSLPVGATKAQIKAAAENLAISKGFKTNSKEFLEAVKRVEDRTDEWNKYSKTYKQWNDRGWIDVSFNYEGNAIPEWRYDKNGNVIGKLTGREKGKYNGFRMVEDPPGSNQFIMEMQNNSTGKFRRITGDIDPVDFTYADGSPLTPEDHARLIKMLQDSPILGAQHGYTSTFVGVVDPKTGRQIVKPGPEIVKKQFKPDEAALQIAPDATPRATRLDVEGSRWVDSYDYNMRWKGGFVDAPPGRGRGTPIAVDVDLATVPVDAPAQIALPVNHDAKLNTVGQAIVNVNNNVSGATAGVAGLVMDNTGRLQRINSQGAIVPSNIHDQAFAEGPVRTITAAPTSVLCAPDGAGGAQGSCSFDVGNGGGGGGRSAGVSQAVSAAQRVAMFAAGGSTSLDAGSTSILVSMIEGLAAGAKGFAAGQKIAIGVDTDRLEIRTVASVADGVITLTEPLEFDHEPDDVVIMVVDANGDPIDANKGFDPVVGPEKPTDPGPGAGGPGSGGPGATKPGGHLIGTSPVMPPVAKNAVQQRNRASMGGSATPPRFAYTGSNSGTMVALAMMMMLFGLMAIAVGTPLRRRRTSVDE